MHPEQQRALDYLARKGTNATVEELRRQVRHAFSAMEAELDAVPLEARDTAPAPGKWSPHQILDHLILSHGPAVPQLASLLAGITPEGVAIPADLDTPPHLLKPWEELRAQLGAIHAEIEDLLARANDTVSLEPKALIEMVVKVDGQPVHWHAEVDWKAFVQGIRVHVLEHREQLRRAVGSAG
jgi:hypothetical protein